MPQDMSRFLLCLLACLRLNSAKQIAHDVKDVFLQGHNEETQLDDLLQMLRRETTTSRYGGGPEATKSPQPCFDGGPSPVNNTVQLGTEATLHCNVKDLADKTMVSWLRRHGDKLTLLSVGEEAYSSETRYSPSFTSPNDWQLTLQATRQSDEGIYECQVSSHPPIIKTFHLTVVVPELEIADERGLPIKNKFYNSGSTIELKCMVSKVPEPTQRIMWHIGDKLLSQDSPRGGISVKTDKFEDGAMSRLFIANANQRDSGSYTCSLGEIAHASVSVIVLNGEAPAAMHVGSSNMAVLSKLLWILPLSSFYFNTIR